MKKEDNSMRSQVENRIRQSTLVTVICDIILIVALVVCLLLYVSVNNADTFEQNVENITNIATAKSELMLSALEKSSHEVEIAHRYCNGKKIDEIMDYLTLISGDEDEYQLLRRDTALSSDIFHVYSGYSTKKKNGIPLQIEYKDTDLSASLYQYASQKAGEICYSQGFTNKTDALRYFAVLCNIEVMVDDNLETYFLVKPEMESDVLDMLQTYTQYGRLATAVCYADGKYLAKDDAFRADNFYDYLYKYNNLSIDERNAIREQVLNDNEGVGYLKYKNLKRQDCIFAYAACGKTANWYVFVSVPTNDFVTGQLLSFFPLIIIIFLAVLFVFNIWRLLIIMSELRQSVTRERIANSSKSSFLSRMSHEIRTPLNAVIGYNTIAKNEIITEKDDSEYKQAESKVLDCLLKSEIASKHLLAIINDVLDMSAVESGKIKVAHELFDFRGLITSLTTVFYSQAKAKKVEFEVLCDTLTEEWFVGDQVRTNQILTNLLSNAIKFTSEGGTVTLKIQQSEVNTNTTLIHFEISDTGIGMSPDYLERIWLPFEQADLSISRRFGGTGLGLSITKNLVSLMNGEISVESTLGVGTTFYVDLTFGRTERPHNSDVSVGTFAKMDFGGTRILLAEDNVMNMEIAKELLESANLIVDNVWNGKEAVERFETSKTGTYAAILMDIQMPEIDGHKATRMIRASEHPEAKTIPIIAMTADAFAENVADAHAAGMNDHIAKPIDVSVLFETLKKYVK